MPIEPIVTSHGSPTGNTQFDPMTSRRIGAALWRRLRLSLVRLRCRDGYFGNGCDVRGGFRLETRPGAKVWIGERCILDRGMSLEASGVLRIGHGCVFGHHCTLGAVKSLEIGDDCLVAELVSIRDHDHRFENNGIPTRDQGPDAAPVRIGRNVWLGAKVTVLKGVTIGDNAIIGANAVVTRDIPANAIAVGMPARVIRMRDTAKPEVRSTSDN